MRSDQLRLKERRFATHWKLRVTPVAAMAAGLAIALPAGAVSAYRAAGWVTAQPDWASNPNTSPDFDFGAGPNLFTTTFSGTRTDVLGTGQKSGMYYVLDPATGKENWATQAGPGGALSGIEWGTSTDGTRIYAALSNGSHKRYTYTPYDGKKKTTAGGLAVTTPGPAACPTPATATS
jgi:polyvinyl alcohol dehydrogenase (cytochrome)